MFSKVKSRNSSVESQRAGSSATPAYPFLASRSSLLGITLTEVLISMGILTLGLLGVAAMFPVGSYYMQKGDTADRASAVAQAAFNDAVTQGILDPSNWYVFAPSNSFVAGAPNTKFSVDGTGTVQTFGRPFAAALNEAISLATLLPAPPLPPQTIVSQQLGNAYVLDPMGVADTVIPSGNFRNEQGSPFPITAWLIPAADYAPTEWGPWKDNSGSVTWPIRRVTFHQPNLAIAGATVPMKVARAEELFSSHDDLAIDLPSRGDAPSTQNWDVTVDVAGDPVPSARQSRGDYSWIITVVPKTVAARNALAYGGDGQAYDVSVVVFYKRLLQRRDPIDANESRPAGEALMAQERVVQAKVMSTGPSGGEVLLTAYDDNATDSDGLPGSPFTNLKTGQWMMLCGPHPDSTELNPRFVLNWYRVLAIDGKDTKLDAYGNPTNAANQPERRLVSLRGPQWPWMPYSPPYSNPLSNYLCAGIFPGAVAVHNRTIQLESSSAFGGSGGGGGASAVTPSRYVPY